MVFKAMRRNEMNKKKSIDRAEEKRVQMLKPWCAVTLTNWGHEEELVKKTAKKLLER